MSEALASSGHGRRERRKAETRARLLEAARRTFVERGYHATRPQDIAAAADLATGTFYVHFEDKADAFRAWSEQAATQLMQRVRAASTDASGFEARLHRSLEALLEYSDENPGTLRAAFLDAAVVASELPPGASLQEQLAESLAQGLRSGAARGELDDDLDFDVIAHGIVGFVSQALRAGAERGVRRATLLREVTRFIGRAVVGTPGTPSEDER